MIPGFIFFLLFMVFLNLYTFFYIVLFCLVLSFSSNIFSQLIGNILLVSSNGLFNVSDLFSIHLSLWRPLQLFHALLSVEVGVLILEIRGESCRCDDEWQ